MTPQEGDKNLTTIRDFVNSLSAAIAISLNPDGTLKADALSLLTQIANVPLFADSFASSRTLSQGVLNAVTNVYAVTVNGFTGYTSGAELQFLANANCLGPSAVNVTNTVGALGNVAILKGGNVPLAPNDIIVGSVVKLVHDGTNFQLVDMYRPLATSAVIGPTILAAYADMIAAADPTKAVTVALLKNHPGVAKAWAVFHYQSGDGSISIGDSWGLATPTPIVRNGVGDYTITFANPFTTNNFCYHINCKSATTANPTFCGRHPSDTSLATAIRIFNYEIGVGLVDPSEITVSIHGNQ